MRLQPCPYKSSTTIWVLWSIPHLALVHDGLSWMVFTTSPFGRLWGLDLFILRPKTPFELGASLGEGWGGGSIGQGIEVVFSPFVYTEGANFFGSSSGHWEWWVAPTIGAPRGWGLALPWPKPHTFRFRRVYAFRPLWPDEVPQIQ